MAKWIRWLAASIFVWNCEESSYKEPVKVKKIHRNPATNWVWDKAIDVLMSLKVGNHGGNNPLGIWLERILYPNIGQDELRCLQGKIVFPSLFLFQIITTPLLP